MAYQKTINSTSPEKETLNAWQDEITARKLESVIKNLQLNDYPSFFKGLLKLLTEKAPNTTVDQSITSYHNVQTKKQHQDADELPEELPYELHHGFEEYGIKSLLECAPTDSILKYCIENATMFIGYFNPKLRRYNRNERNEDYEKRPLYSQILSFKEYLAKYLELFKNNCVNPDNFPYDFELKNDISENFTIEVNAHREKLKDLYKVINCAIDAEKNEYSKELKAYQKNFFTPIN